MSLKHVIPEPIRRWLFWRRVRVLAVVKKFGHALGLSKVIWKLALPSEVAFWDKYLETRGKSCRAEDEFNFRVSPVAELQPWLKEWIDSPEGAELRMLDVGAGPLTWVGKRWGTRKIHIEAVDPLAEVYDRIMERYGITPPVRTKNGAGEEIVEQFGRDVFDMTFARNCLDHAYDAIKAVSSIVEVTKHGGIIYLWHCQNEGENMAYQGLHQWNFRLDGGDLIVWKGTRTFNFNATFSNALQVLRCELREGMIQAIYRKL